MSFESSNDNVSGIESEFTEEDHLFATMKAQGHSEEAIDEQLESLVLLADSIVASMREVGMTEDEIDQALDQFRGYVSQPDIQAYRRERAAQRNRCKLSVVGGQT